jgi:hypothetical protein
VSSRVQTPVPPKKKKKTSWAGSMAQVVDLLSSKPKALNTTKEKNNNFRVPSIPKKKLKI